MKTSLQRIVTVFSKEVRDNLRDRRSLISSLASTLIGPVLMIVLIVVIGKTLLKDSLEEPLILPVVGANSAPNLIAFLEQNNVTIQLAPSDPKSSVRNGDLNLVLVISDDYASDFQEGHSANLQLIVDSTRQSATSDVERARSLLNSYNQQIAVMRLFVRGVSPEVINPILTERVDVSTPQSQVMFFLNMMPYFIILVIFTGGMNVIIDTTAGERERGSLEPLLINPLLRRDLVLGKLAASIPFATASVFITLLAFALSFNLFPLEEYIGFQLTIDPKSMVGIFLISLPMIFFASAVQMIVASFTRSYKEAQTYVAFLPLIPALPGILLAFLPVRPSLIHMLIPTFGQQLLINQLMRGEPMDNSLIAISTIVTIIAAIILIIVAIRLYQRERIILGAR